MTFLAAWNFILGRHDDGTKHTWHTVDYNFEHYCEWSYCHCWFRECSTCEKFERVSNGSDEIR